MASSSIQGQLLEVTVVGCSHLKNTEWLSRQDPYVCLEYGSTKYRTKTHTDGGTNPRFQDRFIFSLIDGMSQLKVLVWNSNTLIPDDYIGSGEIHLQKVLSQGYDDTHWPLYTMNNKSAGDVRVTMHYSQANNPATSSGPSAPPYSVPPPSTASYAHSPAPYSAPPPYPAYPHPPAAYPPQPTAYPPLYGAPPSAYPPQPTAYPSPYAPPPAGYPPTRKSSGSSYYAPDPYYEAYPPRPY